MRSKTFTGFSSPTFPFFAPGKKENVSSPKPFRLSKGRRGLSRSGLSLWGPSRMDAEMDGQSSAYHGEQNWPYRCHTDRDSGGETWHWGPAPRFFFPAQTRFPRRIRVPNQSEGENTKSETEGRVPGEAVDAR